VLYQLKQDILKEVYERLRYPGKSLSSRVVHGGFWVFFLKIVNRGFGLFRTIVLARLLSPNDFGLFGIAMLAISGLQSLSQTGFNSAIIHKKGGTKSYLDPAWTVQVVRGLILAIVLITSAPLVGSFFREPRAILIIRVLGASVLLGSVKNIGIVYFRKELKFHKQFLYRLTGTIADVAVAIPAAIILRSVWALVFGVLSGNLARFIISYYIHPYRPGIDFDWEKIKEMFDFGRWILGGGVVVFIATQGDDIFLGKVLGATSLGFYRLAFRISNTVATEITHVISQVTFPAYSKLQDDLSTLKTAFMKTMSLTAALSIPLAAGIFLFIPEFTEIFLGKKWLPIVQPTRILVIAGAIRSIAAIWGPLYRATGKPKFDFWQNIWRVLFTFGPIYFLAQSAGISGVSVAVLLGITAALGFDFYYVEVIDRINLRSKDLLKSIFLPFIGTLPFIIVTSLFKYFISFTWINFLFIIILDIGLYVGSMYLLNLVTGISFLKNIRDLLKGN